MLSRRSVRIKVMQALYSQFLVGSADKKSVLEIFNRSVEEVINVDAIYRIYIREILAYVNSYSQNQQSKFLVESQDKLIDKEILNSQTYQVLTQDKELQLMEKKQKLNRFIVPEYVKSMFMEMIKLEEYKSYILNPSTDTEASLMIALMKSILFQNEDIVQYLEKDFANIEEDADLVHFSLKKSYKNFRKTGVLNLSMEKSEIEDLKGYAHKLIDETIKHQDEFIKIIQPKLKGWDIERIPVLDMTILKLSLTEMLYFSNIPLKVTVNEYIDITKLFCNHKSKDFINGMMDNMMKDLMSQDLIKKEGRGLE